MKTYWAFGITLIAVIGIGIGTVYAVGGNQNYPHAPASGPASGVDIEVDIANIEGFDVIYMHEGLDMLVFDDRADDQAAGFIFFDGGLGLANSDAIWINVGTATDDTDDTLNILSDNMTMVSVNDFLITSVDGDVVVRLGS